MSNRTLAAVTIAHVLLDSIEIGARDRLWNILRLTKEGSPSQRHKALGTLYDVLPEGCSAGEGGAVGICSRSETVALAG